MLNVLRDNFKARPYLKGLLLIVAISFVGYLGSMFECGGGAPAGEDWAARVNGRVIPTSAFINAARSIDQNYREMLGEGYERFREQLRIGDMAMQTLVEREIVLQDAERLGLAVSNQDIADRIRSDPNLQDSGGQFIGAERYRQAIGRFPGGVAAYEKLVGQDLMVERWVDLVTQPVVVSDDELEQAYRKRSERTSLSYLVVTSADQQVDTKASAEEEQAWYDAHQDAYRRGEGRRIRYLIVDRESQRPQVQVTDDEIRKIYETNQANYTHAEQRRARHILFRIEPNAPDEEKQRARRKAEETLERLRKGEDFAELARTLSQDTASAKLGGDLGFFSRGRMVPRFEEAAFGTAVGQLAPVVETDFGFHVIQVMEAQDAGVTPLEEVQAEIRRQRELARSQELAQAAAERLRGEIGSGERMQQMAEKEGIELHSRVVERGERLGDIGASPEFVEQVFQLGVGALGPALPVASGIALVTVDEVVPPSVAPLAEVRSQVRADLLNERAHAAAQAAAERALRLQGGPTQAAVALHLELRKADDVAPGAYLQGTGGSSSEIEQRLFGDRAQIGERGVVRVPSGAMIYEITGRKSFERQGFEQAKEQLRAELSTARRDQYRKAIIDHLRQQQQVEVNQDTMQRVGG